MVARWGWGPRWLLPGHQAPVACGSGAWEILGAGVLAGLGQSSLGLEACWGAWPALAGG